MNKSVLIKNSSVGDKRFELGNGAGSDAIFAIRELCTVRAKNPGHNL